MSERKAILPAGRVGVYSVIVALALAVRLIGLVYYGVDQGGDAVEYDQIGINLAQGQGYSMSAAAPYVPTTQREPGYPMFLALIYSLFGHSPLAAVLVQCLFGVVACILIYETTRLIYSDQRIAFWAALANAVYIPIVIFSLRLLSEGIEIPLMATVAYLLVCCVARPASWVLPTLLGVAMGLLALTQLIFTLLPAVIVPLMVLLNRRTGFISLRNAAIVGAVMGFAILPWVAVNYSLHGEIALGNSVRMGANIYDRVQDRGMNSGADIYHHLLDLEADGMPTSTVNRIYVKKALDIVREHPIRYAVGTVLEIGELWHFGLNDDQIDVSGPITLHGTRGVLMRSFKYLFQATNILVLFTGILGIVVLRTPRIWPLVALIGYSTLMYSLISYAIPRHNAATLQLMLVFSSAWLIRTFVPEAARSAPYAVESAAT